MKRLIAIYLGKLLSAAGRMLGKKSSSSPGEIALKICPNLISDMNKRVANKIIVTCGTNGKTTTNNVICSALESKGYKVLCNRVGANMLSGVATAYIETAGAFKKTYADFACLEIDEAYAKIIFKYIKPDVMVITNLFRDQLDRYGELDGTVKLINDAIEMADGVTLVLNADDPVCVRFSQNENARTLFYGVSEKVLDAKDTTKEGRYCPICGGELSYNYSHYSQLGDFFCRECGYKRPEPDFNVTDVSLKSPMRFKVNGQAVEVNYKGLYNIMNLAAVYAALSAAGINTDDFAGLLENYKPQTGRMQEFNIGKKVVLSLSKNPAGFNQAIETVNFDENKKDVVIAINDGVGDGRDVSWLWDVNFDRLKNENLNTLTITGIRRFDTALRFKYEDIEVDGVCESMRDALEKALHTDSDIVYVMVNYTALFSTEDILKELEKEYKNEA